MIAFVDLPITDSSAATERVWINPDMITALVPDTTSTLVRLRDGTCWRTSLAFKDLIDRLTEFYQAKTGRRPTPAP